MKDGRRLLYTVSSPAKDLWVVAWSASNPHLKKTCGSCAAALNWALEEANLWKARMNLNVEVLVKDPSKESDYLFQMTPKGFRGVPVPKSSGTAL